MQENDCEVISESFKKQGWNKPKSQYEGYLKYQQDGKRDIIIAELERNFVGYLTINWQSGYFPFRKKNIPEIVDLNVLKNYQRRGIGTILMHEAESRIRNISKYAGIAYGVTKDYGSAQIFYIKRNYKPDGNGLVKDSKSLEYGDIVTIDDNIAFYLLKEL